MSKFEEWKAAFRKEPESFRAEQIESNVFKFDNVVIQLQKLQNNMSYYDLEDMFGEQIGRHLFDKFAHENQRNILMWFNALHDEYRFFIVTNLNKGKWQ